MVELTLSWRDPRDSFEVTDIGLAGPTTRRLQSTSKLKPREPKIEVVGRTRFKLKLRVTRLKASSISTEKSRLSFQIKPVAIAGPALVTIDVRRR